MLTGRKYCVCCGREIPAAFMQFTSCIDCIKKDCSGVGLYTTDGSPRWCKVNNKASEPIGVPPLTQTDRAIWIADTILAKREVERMNKITVQCGYCQKFFDIDPDETDDWRILDPETGTQFACGPCTK